MTDRTGAFGGNQVSFLQIERFDDAVSRTGDDQFLFLFTNDIEVRLRSIACGFGFFDLFPAIAVADQFPGLFGFVKSRLGLANLFLACPRLQQIEFLLADEQQSHWLLQVFSSVESNSACEIALSPINCLPRS